MVRKVAIHIIIADKWKSLKVQIYAAYVACVLIWYTRLTTNRKLAKKEQESFPVFFMQSFMEILDMAHTPYFINQDKQRYLRSKSINGARNYKNRLTGKDFFIVCEDGTATVVRFFKKDFVHLTGILSNLSDNAFFDNACVGRLAEANIRSNQKYNWQTLKQKADRVENIHEIIYSHVKDSLYMTNLHTNTADFPVAIRNIQLDTCIGFTSSLNKARTLRKYANSANADSQTKIIAIFAGPQNTTVYNELVYITDIKLLYSTKPDIESFLDSNILEQFSYVI